MIRQYTDIKSILDSLPQGPHPQDIWFPKGDRQLFRLSGLGRTIRSWRKPGRTGLRQTNRMAFFAKALLTKDDIYIGGQTQTLSATGLFVTANPRVFAEQELIEVTVVPKGGKRSIRVRARVCSVNFDQDLGPIGYGLAFVA